MITLKTNYGDIKLKLDFENTPNTANNFLMYAKEGFYKDTIFHRVINNFMIQGGGFTKEMKQKKNHGTIQNEAHKGDQNLRGTIAMARTNAPHSASSQFFINVKDNPFLNYQSEDNWGYCVFGKVIEGLDVVDKIKAVKTSSKAGYDDVPVDEAVIMDVYIDEN
jgi:peptidyl-prolyl cis-trans isomerase B (cyclophilin B)